MSLFNTDNTYYLYVVSYIPHKIGKNGKNRRAVCKNMNKPISSMSSGLLHMKKNNNSSNKTPVS
jgi:hypothetical protein